VLKPGTRYPALGARRFRAALLPGCVQGALSPAIDAATIRVLTKSGLEVIVPEGTGCCGALSHHLGKRATAEGFAAAAVRALAREMEGKGLDFIVANAAGCGTMVKDYGFLFRADGRLRDAAQGVASRARDVTEVLDEVGLSQVRAPRRLKVAYQSPCSLQHGQKLASLPRRLLSAAGFEVVEPEEAHLCCGSAGSYNLLEPAIAQELRTRKIERLERLKPDLVASGNIGCITHLGAALTPPICHTIELIDWSMGGPEPGALLRHGSLESRP
jgi:glycolate oxidase iron-sulfur subunit